MSPQVTHVGQFFASLCEVKINVGFYEGTCDEFRRTLETFFHFH